MFVASLGMLYLMHRMLRIFWRQKGS